MERPIIEIKYLRPEHYSSLPKYETKGSAAVDLRAIIDNQLLLKPGECELITTGIAIHINNTGLAGMILPRSGLAHKEGLVLGNSVGLIDSDYQGELIVSAWNRGFENIIIEPLTRFSQLIIVPVVQASFTVVDDFAGNSLRKKGGFGHTGII